MRLLLKDCVRYVPHEYKNEAELEAMVFEHYREIFGENSLKVDVISVTTSSVVTP